MAGFNLSVIWEKPTSCLLGNRIFTTISVALIALAMLYLAVFLVEGFASRAEKTNSSEPVVKPESDAGAHGPDTIVEKSEKNERQIVKYSVWSVTGAARDHLPDFSASCRGEFTADCRGRGFSRALRFRPAGAN